MIYVVLENRSNIINPVTEEFKKYFMESSIIYLTSNYTVEDANKFVNPPLFNNSWYFICKGSVRIPLLEKLEGFNCRNVIVITVNSRKALELWQEKLKNIKYNLIDNYRVKKEVILAWIKNRLSIETSLAKLIYSRTNGNLADVVANVTTLETLPFVTKQIILKYVAKRSEYTPFNLLQYLLGIDYRKMKKEDAIQVLYEYRFASSWFYTNLLEELSFIIYVFTLMEDGNLNLRNYHEYKKDTKDKKIRSATDYQLKTTVEMFSCVSLEYVYFLYYQISKYSRDSADVYKLINLIKIV